MFPSKRTILSFFSIAFLFSCKEKPSYKTSADNNSLLWEISGNRLPQASYFLGTMHLMCSTEAVLSDNTKSIIKNVAQTYLEVDMDNMNELLMGMFNLNMKDDKTLQDLLLPNEYEQVKIFFENHQPAIPFSILERQQPMMLASSLYEIFLTCEKKNGIDLRVLEEAAKYKKETKGFETMEFQTSVLDSIPYEEQAQELFKTINNLDTYKSAIDALLKAYRLQNIELLHELSTAEETGTANHLDLLLYDRNKRWADQFENIAKAKPTLFAVGAGHLGGENGVINLLKKKGYAVRPIEN